MGNAVITKGSTISVNGTDIKATVIEDFSIEVGELAQSTITASDGTPYVFLGEQADSSMECRVLVTDDTIKELNTAVYGAGVVVSNTTTWALKNAGESVIPIVITSPTTAGSVQLSWESVNGKGVVFAKDFQILSGYEGRIKFAVDYWNEIVTE